LKQNKNYIERLSLFLTHFALQLEIKVIKFWIVNEILFLNLLEYIFLSEHHREIIGEENHKESLRQSWG